MSNKIIVTKEWHRKAMQAIKRIDSLECGISLDRDESKVVLSGVLNFVAERMSESQQEELHNYLEDYFELIED